MKKLFVLMVLSMTTLCANAQTPFTQEELDLLRKEAPEGDERLDGRNYCVFDNNLDGRFDTSFNMKNACQEAFARGLSPEIMGIEEMREALTPPSSGYVHITSGVWEWGSVVKE